MEFKRLKQLTILVVALLLAAAFGSATGKTFLAP